MFVMTIRSGSAAALAGGLTTISNFGGVPAGETPLDVVERQAALIADQSIADVIVHPIIIDPATATANTLAAQAAAGHTSIKVFMVRPEKSCCFRSNVLFFREHRLFCGGPGDDIR